MNITSIKYLLFALNFLVFSSVFHSRATLAQQEDLCLSPVFECVEAEEISVHYHLCYNCSPGLPLSGRFDSIRNVEQHISSLLSDTNEGCRVTVEASVNFSGYAEPGSGEEFVAPGIPRYKWAFSKNILETAFDAITIASVEPLPGTDPSDCDERSGSVNINIFKSTILRCPISGFGFNFQGFCGEYNLTKTPKDSPCDNATQNPCQVSTGAKTRKEVDIIAPTLDLTRNYHSLNLSNSGFGNGWHTKYFKRLIPLMIDRENRVTLIDNGGNRVSWKSGIGDLDNKYKSFVQLPGLGGYELTFYDDTISKFDINGNLISENFANGRQFHYSYGSRNRLVSVGDEFGKELVFSYENNSLLVSSVRDDSGSVYKYNYDGNNNLISVVYPDLTVDNDQDNPTRTYHYEDANFPHHLTGITDANGVRYATFEYDANGKAILSELAATDNVVGQERIEINYEEGNQ